MFDDLADRLKISSSAVSKMVQVFIDHNPTIRCYPGVCDMLERLRKKFKLGLLTDGRFSVQQKKIRALGLETKFDEIMCSDMLGLEKPANELFEWFEKKFEMTGQSLLYVGDNPIKDFYGANLRSWTTICVMTAETQDLDFGSSFKSYLELSSITDIEALVIPRYEDRH
jgi:putative hydrolase of the HAD superfamily